MKILYSCLSKSWGGMEMFTITAVKQLLKKNITVELLCLSESRLHIEAVNAGLITYPIKASGYFHPFSIIRTVYIIRKTKYDLIHTQASKDLWLLVPALKLLHSKIPLILTKQVGSFIIKKDIFHKLLYGRLTYALAISNVIKKNLIETCPLLPEKILLMHNGIDTNVFDPENINRQEIRKEFNIKEDEITIGMLARFSPGKGHEEFLSAAKELNKNFNNIKFLVVGEASRGESEYENTIKKMADNYSIKNLVFTGFRGDTPRVLAAMDIFVFPSHNEAFGIALAEAMAMGKPSVCSNSDGILDVAIDGETSLLFDVKNSNDLKNKIESLVNSPELRIKMGNAARKRAEENFDLNLLTNRVIEIYKSVIN